MSTLSVESPKALKKSRRSKRAASTLEDQPIPANIVKTLQELLQLVCQLSLSNGNFIDTKFYAYSRRSASGTVYGPKAVYANSLILRIKVPEYFGPLLRGDYMGNCATGSLYGDLPSEFPAEGDGEGYDSDSDLEDDKEDKEEDDQPEGHVAAKTPSVKDDTRSSSALPLVSDDNIKETGDRSDNKDTQKGSGSHESHDSLKMSEGLTGRIRLMERFAYPTWNAFIYYLYTGKVNFAPLKSQDSDGISLDSVQRDAISANPPRCSPKSMYRLADELGLDDLKELAKTDIRSKLSTKNITMELFSSFTSKYDAIKDLQIAYACSHAKDTIKSNISARLKTLSLEELGRSVDTIASLIQKIGDVPPPAAPVSTIRSSGNQLHCNSCGVYRTFRCYSCSQYWAP